MHVPLLSVERGEVNSVTYPDDYTADQRQAAHVMFIGWDIAVGRLGVSPEQ